MKRLLLFALALCAWAQTNGITTTASRTVTLAPDGAEFSISVSADPGTTLDQILAALKDTGITAANLVAAGSSNLVFDPSVPPGGQPQPRVLYAFQVSVPFAKIKDLGDTLNRVRNALRPQFSFYLTASDGAYQQARQKLMPELIAEARQRAESLAVAGNLDLGALESLNETTPPAAVGGGLAGFLLAVPSGRSLQTAISIFASFAARPKRPAPCDTCPVSPARPEPAPAGGIAGSASRNVTLAPDGADFRIDLTTDLSTTLDQAVAALTGTGITSANLVAATSIFLGEQLSTGLLYSFELSVPTAKIRELDDKLDAARKALAAGKGRLQHSFYLTAGDGAFQQARQRLVPELIAEARKNAEFLASAGELNLGSLLSLNENVYSFGNAIPAARVVAVTGFSSTGGGGGGLQGTISVYARFAAQPK